MWVVSTVAAERFVAPPQKGNDLNNTNDCLNPGIPCATIKQAIDRSDAGDIIKVEPGPYRESNLIINKRLIMLATESEKEAVIQADADKCAIIIIGKAAKATEIGIMQTKCGAEKVERGQGADGSRIEGFKIEASPNAGAAALWIEGVSSTDAPSIVVKGNRIELKKGIGILLRNSSSAMIQGNKIMGTKPGNESGIKLDRSSNNVLLDNNVSNNGTFGIDLSESSGNKLIGNEANDNTLEGIVLSSSERSPSERNELLMNEATNNRGGISLKGRHNNTTLQGNLVDNNRPSETDGGITVDGELSDITLASNIVTKTKNKRPGIVFKFTKGSNNKLLNNEVNGNEGGGIFFNGSNGILSGNIANDNEAAGIELSGSNNALTDNMTSRNKQGAGIAVIKGSKNNLSGNIVNFNNIGISLEGGAENTLSGNTIGSNNCHGIELKGSSSNKILNNTLIGNGKACPPDKVPSGTGVAFTGESVRNVLFGNTILANLNGISIWDSSKGNTFRCNNILYNQRGGVQLAQVEGNNFTLNNIAGNLSFGLHNLTNQKADAKNNWWGDPSGPYHPNDNPEGKGDKILGQPGLVIFSPWLLTRINLDECS